MDATLIRMLVEYIDAKSANGLGFDVAELRVRILSYHDAPEVRGVEENIERMRVTSEERESIERMHAAGRRLTLLRVHNSRLTHLPTTRAEARAYLRYLHQSPYQYHLEDDPHEIDTIPGHLREPIKRGVAACFKLLGVSLAWEVYTEGKDI